MTDDVKALAEEIAAHCLGSDDAVYSSKHVANILEHWKDRLASQREDGTIWGQIAAVYGDLDLEDRQFVDRAWLKMRGSELPQREDIIDREAIARIIDPNCKWDLPSPALNSEQRYRKEHALSKADAIIRSLPTSREAIIEDARPSLVEKEARDSMASRVKNCQMLFASDAIDILLAFDRMSAALAAQPRSNSVEDGAGRNSIQIESSSDTASANAKSGIAK